MFPTLKWFINGTKKFGQFGRYIFEKRKKLQINIKYHDTKYRLRKKKKELLKQKLCLAVTEFFCFFFSLLKCYPKLEKRYFSNFEPNRGNKKKKTKINKVKQIYISVYL